MAHMSPYDVCSRKCAFLCMYMCMHAFICVHECMYRGAPGKATLCMCVYIWSTLLQHMANAMHQLPSHRVGRGELVVELAGHHLEQQIVHLKASKSETQTRNTRAARRSRRRASLADVVGPQKTILPSTRMTREYVRFLHSSMLMSMRSIFAAEAGCSTGSTLLHLLHHVVGAIPLQLFLDLDSDETNGVVVRYDANQ